MMRRREKTKKTNHEHQHIDTLIGVHATFTGELSFEGALRIDGQFEGNIHAKKGGVLIVSEGAKITGEVDVPCLILHGTIHGNVHASESLKLGSTGCLHGDVEYHVMSLSEGSSINGRCSRISTTLIDKKTITTNTTAENTPINSPQQAPSLEEV